MATVDEREATDAPEPQHLAAEGRSLRHLIEALAGAASAGLIAGVLIGGVGGRLAMLVLRLTSSRNVIGAETVDRRDGRGGHHRLVVGRQTPPRRPLPLAVEDDDGSFSC